MAVKKTYPPKPKYQTTPEFDIVVTKLVTVGHVVENANGSMTPLEAAMAMIGRDIEEAHMPGTTTHAIDHYEFRIGERHFQIETSVKHDSHDMPMTDEWTS